jgi:hypothetical protein
VCPSPGRQEGEVYDADLTRPAGEVEASDGKLVQENDEKVGVSIIVLVVLVLGGELHLEETCHFVFVPIHQCQLLPAGASIDLKEEGLVVGTDGTEGDRHQLRGGNTPCNAMQKKKVRYGCRLLWGWSPPAGDKALGFILTGFVFVVV